MGESVVDAADKMMGEMAPSNPALEVSISFGRFENDSLSWERWSSFSPNKYIEEVEKCATPGSVAQKKAYFEEHYKKIAARKGELFSQEKGPMKSTPLKSEEPTQVDPSLSPDEPDSGCGSEHAVEKDHQAINLSGDLDETNVNELSEETAIVEDCQSSLLEGVKEEVEEGLNILRVREPEDTDVEVEQPLTEKQKKVRSVEAQGSKDSLMDTEREMKSKTQLKVRKAKPDHPTKSSKFSPVAKESDASAVRRKPFSSAAKVPELSTLRASKPTPPPSIKSASQATRKTGSDSMAKVTNLSVARSRKVAPKSLHMSLNLASPSPESAPIRKSSIMEKMGDKEIVKRAFKTFQNNYSLQKSSGNDHPALPKQVPSKAIETRLSSVTPRKENGGSLRMTGGDSGEKKNAKAAPSSLGLRSDEKTAEKKKELPKKSGEQANHKKSEKTRMSAKLKTGI